MRVGDKRHAPVVLPPPPSKEIRYPLYRRLDGLEDRSGRVQKTSPHRYSIPRSSTPYRVAIPSNLAGTIKTLISLRNLLCGTVFLQSPCNGPYWRHLWWTVTAEAAVSIAMANLASCPEIHCHKTGFLYPISLYFSPSMRRQYNKFEISSFFQSLFYNDGIVSQVRLQLLLSTSSPIHYLLIALPLDPIFSELL